jgi:hypothetical protein
MHEEGDWLRFRTENGMGQDVLRRPGELKDEWYGRALAAFEWFVSHPRLRTASAA